MAKKQPNQIVETPTEARQAEPGPSVLSLSVVSLCFALPSSLLLASGTCSFAPDGAAKLADPSVWLASINTGLVILAFGAVWVVVLRGPTALGRMPMVSHFHI
jgi:hypothetical protein